ncbi:MAG: DNA polymerase IV [Acidimicrobiaceae bacterium]|nr:DNA polymerase IV [Acidimicrobiaceae bacterium]
MSNSPVESPSLEEAPILHVDLDAFFASVEILDDPTLRGKPVCVGGAAERGVIASASYEARRHGVRSAMPSVVARRLCPELIMLPGRFDRYEEYSHRFRSVVNDLTPNYEPLGLDEVFADLRSLRRLGVNPLEAAWKLRQRIRDELKLECGVGLGRNKLFAKLASKKSKPHVVNGELVEGDGVVWVSPDLERQWLAQLPVQSLWGVGPQTAQKLHQLGFRWVRDLAKVDEATLARHLGSAMAATLISYAHGEDERSVELNRELKSLGHDETFAISLTTLDQVLAQCRHHAGVVVRALRAQGRVARTVSVVVKFDDLQSVSRSQTLPFGVDDEAAMTSVAQALVRSVELSRPVRLLGLYASSFLDRAANQVQLSFDVVTGTDLRSQAIEVSREQQVSSASLRDALDDIRRRYGASSVGVAADIDAQGLRIERQRGSHSFGPEGPV